MPIDQTSDRTSSVLEAWTCSGDIYAGDPTAVPSAVSFAAAWSCVPSRSFAIPKSSTLTTWVPSGRFIKNRFDGLISR